MTPTQTKIFAGVIVGLVTAISVDCQAYIATAKEDPNAIFSWKVAVARWVNGAITGGLAGAGLSAVA